MPRSKTVRPQIEEAMAADLGITDKQQTSDLFENILIPNLTRLGELKVPLFFLVTTRDKLKQLLIDGWRDPRLHYNKVNDDVQFAPTLELTLDRPLDDYIVPAMYRAGDARAAKARARHDHRPDRGRARRRGIEQARRLFTPPS